MADRPNILILMTDQQKASAIGLYGNPDVPTPALERLAARGVRYDRCYTPHPLCVPARVSLWTGRYPQRHGAHEQDCLAYVSAGECYGNSLLVSGGDGLSEETTKGERGVSVATYRATTPRGGGS